MLRLFVYAIPYVLAVVLLIASIHTVANFRRSQRATYFRLRREAARAAWRWLLILVASTIAVGLALTARKTIPPPELDAFQLPLEIASESASPTPTSLQPTAVEPSEAAVPTKDLISAPPTIPSPSLTPTITLTASIATIESQITPPANASITITAISSGISASLEPVDIGTEFPFGIPRIYVWINYQDMADGSSWSRVLRLNGDVVRSESEAWERGAEGIAYYFFDAQGGWPAGAYEVTFFIGDKLVASAQFSMIN